jgi:hypothetical protein
MGLFGTVVSAGSPLLIPEEPAEGLLGDAAAYTRLAAPGEGPAQALGYAQHMRAVQRHYLAVEGRHPPVYYFFCTVYYVPRQSGFTAEAGFDMRPDTRLKGKPFPRSFVRAVRMEGTGKLAEAAPDGRHFINHLGGYLKAPLGNRNNVLTPRKSAAVHRRNSLFTHGTRLRVMDPAVYHSFGATGFETGDTGGGLFPSQIDLYWGEDDPRGPMEIARPASCEIAVRWIVPVIVGGGG